MNLLLLSNSTNPGEEYLAFPRQHILEFLEAFTENIIFIPFAGVTISWDAYTANVNHAFNGSGITVNGIHRAQDPRDSILKASALIMGGGNSFQLLNLLYKHDLIKVIQEKVQMGMPYVGWSAGTNMACPTLMTTNDMPIVQPPDFRALSLIPFQINPHYTEQLIPNHGGETREARLREFIEVNRNSIAIGLPEGMIIRLVNGHYSLVGDKPVKIFQYGKEPFQIRSSSQLNQLLRNL